MALRTLKTLRTLRTLRTLKAPKALTAPSHLLFLLEIIIVHLDAEDDDAARSGDEIGDEKRPHDVGLMENALHHETKSANPHHQKSGEGNAIGVLGTDGLNGLGQVAQHHGDAGRPTE